MPRDKFAALYTVDNFNMQVIAPPGIAIWGAPRNGAASSSMDAAIPPSAYNQHRLQNSSQRSFPFPQQNAAMAGRGSSGVDDIRSALPLHAPAPSPESYNVGRLQPAVVRVAPVGSPPSNAKSEAYLAAAAADGVSTAASVGLADKVDPIALHARVKALMEGDLDPDEMAVYEQYIGRLKIYGAISKARPLTNQEQAAVDEIAQDVASRTEALVREDAAAVATRDENVRVVERDISEAANAEASAAELLRNEPELRTKLEGEVASKATEVKEKVAEIKAAAEARLELLADRINIIRDVRTDLQDEKKDLKATHSNLMLQFATTQAEIKLADDKLSDGPKSASQRANLERGRETAIRKLDKIANRLEKNEALQAARIPIIKGLSAKLAEEIKELESEAKEIPAQQAAVSDALIEEAKVKIPLPREDFARQTAAAQAVVAANPLAAALTRREAAKDFIPNKRFAGSNDSARQKLERFIVEEIKDLKSDLGVRVQDDIPEEKGEPEPDQDAKEEAKAKLQRYKTVGDDDKDTWDRFIALHKTSGANGPHYINYDDVAVKANKGIFGINTLWREMYPRTPAPWEGRGLKTLQLAKAIAGRPGPDALIEKVAKKLSKYPEFRIRVLEHYGWEPPEPGPDTDSEAEA